MPELPDVEIFKQEAQKALGSYVSGSDIQDKHFVDTSKYALDLRPETLEIGEDEFLDKLADSHAMIKRFLMDQSEISGIGNAYSDEILFQAGENCHKCSGLIKKIKTGDQTGYCCPRCQTKR